MKTLNPGVFACFLLGVVTAGFLVGAATGAASEPSGTACRSPLTDPRDGTRLTLVRSNAGLGDYQPDNQRYGLAANQLLRINCSDGRPVGATIAAP